MIRNSNQSQRKVTMFAVSVYRNTAENSDRAPTAMSFRMDDALIEVPSFYVLTVSMIYPSFRASPLECVELKGFETAGPRQRERKSRSSEMPRMIWWNYKMNESMNEKTRFSGRHVQFFFLYWDLLPSYTVGQISGRYWLTVAVLHEDTTFQIDVE